LIKRKFLQLFIGTLPNGTQFFVTIPANITTVTENEQRVEAVWKGPSGETVASLLSTTGPPRTFDVSFDYPPLGISGSLNLIGTNTPSHTACSGDSSGSRYFDPAIPAGASLNAAQTEFFNNLGWAIAMPGTTSAEVTIAFNGDSVSFQGAGYHDKNWADKPIDQYVNTWLFGLGSCGVSSKSFPCTVICYTARASHFKKGYLMTIFRQ
jgi:hypothetical protein